MKIAAGHRLGDKYTVVDTLGAGGSSQSYLAEADDGQRFAIKTLHLGQVEDWKSIQMFERQFTALEHLRHPHIPRVFEMFSQDVEHIPRQFLVQEYIQGKNLKALLESGHRFDEKSGRRLLLEMLDVLEYLHQFSPPILHRDIKPSNIVLRDADMSAVLIDFDTARLSAIDASVADGTMIGTAGYVPLEQLSGHPQPSSDLYALGMTLIRVLSGKDPTDLPVESMRVQFRPFLNVSEALSYTIERMIEPDVAHRAGSVEDVRHALGNGPPTAMVAAPASAMVASASRDLIEGQEVLVPVKSIPNELMMFDGHALGWTRGESERAGHLMVELESGSIHSVREKSLVAVTDEGIEPRTQIYHRGMHSWELTWVTAVSGRLATVKHPNSSFQSDFFNKKVDISTLRQPLLPEDRVQRTRAEMTLSKIKSDPFGTFMKLIMFGIFAAFGAAMLSGFLM